MWTAQLLTSGKETTEHHDLQGCSRQVDAALDLSRSLGPFALFRPDYRLLSSLPWGLRSNS